MREVKYAYKVSKRNHKRRDHLGDAGVEGRIILK
jgi:hypothetical protein